MTKKVARPYKYLLGLYYLYTIMALYSSGCKAMLSDIIKVGDKYVVATVFTCRKYINKNGKEKYPKDWEMRALLSNPNNVVLHKGDAIIIKQFHLRNIVFGKRIESCVIEEWEIDFRNKYKGYEKSKKPKDIVAQEQREQIEAELQEQEAELDELINDMNEDDCPF